MELSFNPGIFNVENSHCSLKLETVGKKTSCYLYGIDHEMTEEVLSFVKNMRVVCKFSSKQGKREKGIYKSGKIVAELDFVVDDDNKHYLLILEGQGYCLEEIKDLCHKIRVGEIKPQDSYDKDCC